MSPVAQLGQTHEVAGAASVVVHGKSGMHLNLRRVQQSPATLLDEELEVVAPAVLIRLACSLAGPLTLQMATSGTPTTVHGDKLWNR